LDLERLARRLPTLGISAQVAELVLFLASDKARHITGTEIWIDGGQSLLQG